MPPDPLANIPRVFQGSRFDVCTVLQTNSQGQSRSRDIVVHPGAVVILPLLDEQTFVLIRNHRVSINQELWELPAGTIEHGEPPQSCAARELIEETGYQAKQVTELTSFYSSPGICNEFIHTYLARGLTHVGQKLDQGEQITAHPIPIKQTMQMIQTGEIHDGKTIAAILFYLTFHTPIHR